MPRDPDVDLSELEREFELEMEDYELPPEGGDLQEEFEGLEDSESQDEEFSDAGPDYGKRLYDLSLREFESESEAGDAVNEVLDDMEREYFWGALKKAAKKVGVKKLVNAGWQLAKKRLPALNALQAVSALSRGNLKSFLGNAVKAGLGAAVPGAAPFLPSVLGNLGFEATDHPEENREAWSNMADVASEAYANLAENLNEEVANPAVASRVAANAFQKALSSVAARSGGRAAQVRLGRRGASGSSRTRVVYLNPGDKLVIRVSRR